MPAAASNSNEYIAPDDPPMSVSATLKKKFENAIKQKMTENQPQILYSLQICRLSAPSQLLN